MPSEPVRDLERESCLATPEAILQVAVRVVEQERGLELQVNAPEFTLATTLPVVNVIEAAMVLKRESCLAKPEAILQVAVRVVEQERGLELQVNAPELTLATMLPIVNAIEAAKVLKIEDFSAKLEAKASEPLRDLKREVCLTKPEAILHDTLK